MVAASARRSTIIAALILTMGAGITSCNEEENVVEWSSKPIGAEEVCSGLFSGPLAKKVESVTGDTVFSPGSKVQNLEEVVEALKRDHASGRSWGGVEELCKLRGDEGGLTNKASISFLMYAPEDVEGPPESPDTVSYTMGKKSEARNRSASLYLECTSTHLKGSNLDPLRLHGSFTRGESDAPGTRETREANLEILHTAALVVVKELECKDNAGLPEALDFTVKEAQ